MLADRNLQGVCVVPQVNILDTKLSSMRAVNNQTTIAVLPNSWQYAP